MVTSLQFIVETVVFEGLIRMLRARAEKGIKQT